VAVRSAARLLLLPGMLTLSACAGALPDLETFRAPDAATLFRPLSVTNYKDNVLPPVAPEDLVDAGGSCAGASMAAASSADQPVPAIPAAIALEMSECDVVKRAGTAERVELGTNERNERTARLTYINGQRPGFYNFVAGRLVSMERAPEPVPAAKPAKKPAKPATRAAKPNQVSVQ
jgi:hypothetical protein